MGVYFGTTEITGLNFGDTEITGLYFGDTEIWAAWAEYDGTLPAQYTANGSMLADYRVYGSAGGVGDRTENLLDIKTAIIGEYWIDDARNTFTYHQGSKCYFIPVLANTSYTVTDFTGILPSGTFVFRAAFTNEIPTAHASNIGTTYLKQRINSTGGGKHTATLTNVNYAYLAVQITAAVGISNNVVISEGSTAPAEYVPYGYVVPMAVRGDVYIDKDKGIYGYTIAPNGIVENYNWWVSGYIHVVEGATYTGVKTGQDMLLYSEIGGTATGATGLRDGYTIPQGKHYIKMNVEKSLINSFTVSVEYPSTQIYIGDDPLGEDEYISYNEQKVYRMSGGVLTPTDPPVPLPALPTVDGETITDYAGQSTPPSRFYAKYKKG